MSHDASSEEGACAMYTSIAHAADVAKCAYAARTFLAVVRLILVLALCGSHVSWRCAPHTCVGVVRYNSTLLI